MTDSDRRAFLGNTAGALAAFAIQPSLAALPRSPAEPLSVGLIGCGRQGRAILAELQKLENVHVAGVADIVPARVRSGTRRARGAAGHEDHRALLDDKDIAAVIVATPTHLHRDIAVDALAADKHVYCEAPLASTAEDARAIAVAARRSKKTFQTGLQGRSDPIYKLARSFFRSGALRDLVSLNAQDHQKTSWRIPSSDPAREKALNWRLDPAVSIGLPGELGTHQFDVFHWFLGRYPTAVRGTGAVRYYTDGREIADTAQCDLTFDDGVRLQWQATLCNSYQGRFEQISGSMAAIKLAWTAGWMFKEADSPTQGWEVYANRQSFHNDEGITLIADATKLAEQGKLKEGVGLPHPPLYYALSDFVGCVADGSPVACSAEEGVRAAVVGEAAQRAVVSGDEVAIDPAAFEVR